MSEKLKYLWIFSVLTALALVAAQCGSQVETGPIASQTEDKTTELSLIPLNEGEKLKAVATTSIVADMVKIVGGEAIDLMLLLPVGTDPHAFDPAPSDLAAVADAHMVFANGLGLEEFLHEMLENTGGEAVLIVVSDGIEPRQFVDRLKNDGDHDGDHNEHGDSDPHAWTSPANALIFVDNIERALSALDPANAETYRANAEAYKSELKSLDAWVAEQIESIPSENRELVTDHTAFGYYADRYGLTQVGAVIPSFSSAAEPSAKDLAALEKAIEEYDVKAIFVGVSVNPALAEQVASDTGVELVKLYTGSLGPQGSGVESYLDYIRYNTSAIVDALQ